MSEKQTKKKRTAVLTSFSYRNIKKDFVIFPECKSITEQKHLDYGENRELIIVEDKPKDWFALTQKDADKVGLANLLEIARRTGSGVAQFAYNDSEAVDLSEFDPSDPQEFAKKLDSSEPSKKLESIASQLGVSVDDLISSFVKGTLADLISSKVEKKEDKDNA